MKLKLLWLMVGYVVMGHAMPVTLPGETILMGRFVKIGYGQFATQTGIVKAFAGQIMEPLIVVAAIDDVFARYKTKVTPEIADVMEKNKALFYEAFLYDCPKALQELQKIGFYNPVKGIWANAFKNS